MMFNLIGKKVRANSKSRGTLCKEIINNIEILRKGIIINIHPTYIAFYPYLIRWDNNKSSYYTREEFDIMSNKDIFKYII